METIKTQAACLFLLLVGKSIISAQNEIDSVMAKARGEMMGGDVESAKTDFHTALEDAKRAHDYMREFLCEESLSQLSAKQNDPEDEEKWLLTGLATLEASHKNNALTALIDLDQFYNRHREAQKRIEILRRIVSVWTKTAGPKAIGTARYNLELAEVLMINSDIEAAGANACSGMEVLEKNGPLYVLPAARARRTLIRVLQAQGKTDDAEKLKASLAPEPPRPPRAEVMPQLVSKVEPKYSELASRMRISGNIALSLDVDESGHPINVELLLPLEAGLDQSAIEAVKQWVFKPATKNGVPTSQHATVEVSFRLL